MSLTSPELIEGYPNKTERHRHFKMDITLNESWISGKYSCGVIDTSLGTAEIFDDEEGFFARDEHAWEIISEIHQIWVNGDLTAQQAFRQWISQNI